MTTNDKSLQLIIASSYYLIMTIKTYYTLDFSNPFSEILMIIFYDPFMMIIFIFGLL